jgi:hypothetical protein
VLKARAVLRRCRQAVRRTDQCRDTGRPGRPPLGAVPIAKYPTENRNLADQHRDKLIEQIAQWYVEAGKYSVLPIDGSGADRAVLERPRSNCPRTATFTGPAPRRCRFWVGPRMLNRPHSITADAEIPDGGAEGMLLRQGSAVGGWPFYVQDGRLHYAHN